MTPIEQVWDLVDRRFARDSHPAALKDEFWLRMQATWNCLPQADIQKLLDSMPRRIAALISHMVATLNTDFGRLFIYLFICSENFVIYFYTNTSRLCINFI